MKVLLFQPRSAAGNRESCEHLVGRVLIDNLDSLYSTACRLTGRADLAEDLVQETARKALKGATYLKSERNVRGWLFTILVNSVRDHLRRGEVWEVVDPEDCGPEIDCDLQSLSLATVQDVREALSRLTPPQRAAVVLVDIEEFTIAEAANMLGVPPGTVASRLARAHQELRGFLRAYRTETFQRGGQP